LRRDFQKLSGKEQPGTGERKEKYKKRERGEEGERREKERKRERERRKKRMIKMSGDYRTTSLCLVTLALFIRSG
jgi:hypothetical protein